MEKIRKEKLGLSLSGGGLRASLFHIGVLARLADTGILKKVEVLSCVSGGSIIGAYYYLYLKSLLETKPDSNITNDDYIGIIKNIEMEFTEAVHCNIRVRVYSNFLKNLKMVKEEYSSSDRLAGLLDKFFYDRFKPFVKKDSSRSNEPIFMRDLLITPYGWEANESFHPSTGNAGRVNKIPALILNATTLNTGRNWQFSAVDIGEHNINDYEFNKNNTFRSFRYSDPELDNADRSKYRKFPLSAAVAASACVPGIFTPLALTKLYPQATPQLVDGGVYDNQSISPVVYEKCTKLIISDAAGQMDFKGELNSSISGVLGRTFSTFMDRIKNLGIGSAIILKEAGIFDSVSLFHLKMGISNEYLEPGKEQFKTNDDDPLTYYRVNKSKQKMLAAMRTDLDAFSDIEAFCLMKSAYNMAECDANIESMRGNKQECAESDYKFQVTGSYLQKEPGNDKYDKVLKLSCSRLFRAYRLMPLFIPLALIGILVSFSPFLLLLYFEPEMRTNVMLVISVLAVIALLAQVAGFKVVSSSRVIKFVNHFITIVFGLPLSVVFTLYNKFINPVYIKYGKVK
jgi:NTE family protein